jgi:hypothetical protein
MTGPSANASCPDAARVGSAQQPERRGYCAAVSPGASAREIRLAGVVR